MNQTENEFIVNPYTTNTNAPIVFKTRIFSSDFSKKDSRTSKVANIPMNSLILSIDIGQELLSCV